MDGNININEDKLNSLYTKEYSKDKDIKMLGLSGGYFKTKFPVIFLMIIPILFTL